MKLDSFYHFDYSGFLQLYGCIYNVSADASFYFLRVFYVEVGTFG